MLILNGQPIGVARTQTQGPTTGGQGGEPVVVDPGEGGGFCWSCELFELCCWNSRSRPRIYLSICLALASIAMAMYSTCLYGDTYPRVARNFTGGGFLHSPRLELHRSEPPHGHKPLQYVIRDAVCQSNHVTCIPSLRGAVVVVVLLQHSYGWCV